MHAAPLRAAPGTTSHLPAAGLGAFLHENFDLASIRSSFGPRRTSAERTFADFKLVPTQATADLLAIEDPNWYYKMRVSRRGDFNRDGIEDLDVCFTDQGRAGARYFSQQSLIITRYAADAYAVALSFSGSACETFQREVHQAQVHPSDTGYYERIGRFIYRYHRIAQSVDGFIANPGRHAPKELLLRAGELAERFNSAAEASFKITDEEMAAILDEAAAVDALVRDWQRKPR